MGSVCADCDLFSLELLKSRIAPSKCYWSAHDCKCTGAITWTSLNDFQQNLDFKTSPIILDSDFKVEELVSDLSVPVNMEFIGNDLLVLEKNSGTVRHIKDGLLLDSPVLDVEVSNYGEHGLLGITSVKNDIYLFFTEAYHDGGRALENRVYKYFWNGSTKCD